MKRIVLLLLVFIPQFVFAHSYPFGLEDKMFSLSYEQADYYKAQACIGFDMIEQNNFNEDYGASVLKFNYAMRLQKDNKVDHRFKFLFTELSFVISEPEFQYRNPKDTTIQGRYLCSELGLKILEFSNLGVFREFTAFRIDYGIVLQKRRKVMSTYDYASPEYIPEEHSFYFRPKLTLEMSNTKLDKVINDRYLHSNKGAFWDIPIGGELKLGYDRNIQKENVNKDYEGLATASIMILGGYKIFPFNDVQKLSYGISDKLKIKVNQDILVFSLEFSKNKLSLASKSYSYNSYSLGLTYYN